MKTPEQAAAEVAWLSPPKASPVHGVAILASRKPVYELRNGMLVVVGLEAVDHAGPAAEAHERSAAFSEMFANASMPQRLSHINTGAAVERTIDTAALDRPARHRGPGDIVRGKRSEGVA